MFYRQDARLHFEGQYGSAHSVATGWSSALGQSVSESVGVDTSGDALSALKPKVGNDAQGSARNGLWVFRKRVCHGSRRIVVNIATMPTLGIGLRVCLVCVAS